MQNQTRHDPEYRSQGDQSGRRIRGHRSKALEAVDQALGGLERRDDQAGAPCCQRHHPFAVVWRGVVGLWGTTVEGEGHNNDAAGQKKTTRQWQANTSTCEIPAMPSGCRVGPFFC
ncbi:MAG: hypothetical protein KJN93_01470, partial [Alphaproteobacteria bacterium]|nr:hypothetical protein [Alphaproteobacteria bacterium]